MHQAVVDGLHPGDRYRIALDGDGPFPDPWSRWQPDGVHGDSALVATASGLSHRPVPRRRAQATYELHVGTFTPEGDYSHAAGDLARLRRLGLDTVQLMPVAEFPGRWNWGYDGACFYAPTRAYGTPDALRRLVARAHRERLSVLLDVVYNHLGPDGAYIYRYAPEFFTDRQRTPWGGAIDYTRPEVRRTVTDAARWWIQQYGFDGLRLDATHAIFDENEDHILAEIGQAARRGYRRAYVAAEDHRNLARLVLTDRLDAILADDFHHAVRVSLTHQQDHYFGDYRGTPEEIAVAIQDGWIHQGGRTSFAGPGTPTTGLPASAFVFGIENHDQVGNRADALHLAGLVEPGQFRVASALLLLAPERAMLFQGQEFASRGHFYFFTDHEPELGRAVTAGRRREFAGFREYREHPERIADPQHERSFLESKLDRGELAAGRWATSLYRELFRLRIEDPVLRRPDREATRAWTEGKVVYLERWAGRRRRLLAATLHGDPQASPPRGRVILHTEEKRFGGSGLATLRRPGAILVEP
jgi:maltooligosyltrehalose trehalohydrolase